MGHHGGVRRWGLDLVFAAYLIVVAIGVFGPSPGGSIERVGQEVRRVGAEVGSTSRTSRTSQLEPGHATPPGAEPNAAGRDLVRGFDTEDVANVVMFVPFGVLFAARWPRRRWWTVAAGVGLSVSIELVQLVFLSWRSPSLIDVRSNSLGAAIGFALWLAVRAARRGRPPSTQAAGPAVEPH